jgi:hypothetical protein
MIIYASSFLKGKAITWFEPYFAEAMNTGWKIEFCKKETRDIFTSMHGFEDVFKSLFQEPDERRQAERKFQELIIKG